MQAEIIAGYYELENEAAQAVIRRAELRIQAREPDAALEIMVGLEDGIQSGSMEEALLLHARGTARRLQEQYSLAVELLEKAVRLAEKNHDLIAASGSLYQLASAYSLQGQYETAAEHMRQALAYDRQMENSPGIASALEALARISLKQNRNEEATIYVQRAFAVYQEMGNSEGLQRISELAAEQGLQLNTNLAESVWEQMIR